MLSLHFYIGHANNNVLELIMFPCVRRTFNHSQRSIILNFASRVVSVTMLTKTYVFIILDV